MKPAERLVGCLIGTAVGDSLLLPAEGLSRRQIERRFGEQLTHGLLFGRGMVSDDTDHSFLLARCLAAEPRDVAGFSRRLAWRLRWWLLCLPAGCGKATGQAIVRLWLGFSPARSGVASGGNGPSMRAAIIGAFFAQDSAVRRAFGLGWRAGAQLGLAARSPAQPRVPRDRHLACLPPGAAPTMIER